MEKTLTEGNGIGHMLARTRRNGDAENQPKRVETNVTTARDPRATNAPRSQARATIDDRSTLTLQPSPRVELQQGGRATEAM